MQVFYVNIGGGEPTVRQDFWELRRLRDRPPASASSSPPTASGSTPERAALARRQRLRRRADLARRRDRRGQRRRPRPGLLRHGDRARWSTCADAGFERLQDLASSPPGRTSASSTSSRRSPTATAPSCGSRGCAPPAAAPTSGTSCTRPPAQQRELYDWLLAHGERGAHRRLVLPPRGVRRAAARAEPLRRRPRRLPDRPGRRRLRLPVRDPRRVPGRQRPRRRAGSPASGATRSCSPSCARRRPAARARRCALLRLLPRRLHGGEVLHRPAARRPGPRVRARPRRARSRRAARRHAADAGGDHSRAAAPLRRTRSPSSPGRL